MPNFRRKFIQLVSAVLFNAHFAGFANGTIYTGKLKSVCAPSLNCYSCPGALGSCPLGSLQSALGSMRFPALIYVVGTLLMIGALIGRAVCAFLCPFGLIQELLYKIPTPKIEKSRITRILSYAKYAVLMVFVIALPIIFWLQSGVGVPAFCKYICPAGTLEGGIPLLLSNSMLRMAAGDLFIWKISLLVIILVAAVFIYRAFCRFLCPLGAIYSLIGRWAIFTVKTDETKCIHCDRCVRACKMDVRHIGDAECLRCGDCASVCPTGAVVRPLDSLMNNLRKDASKQQ